jgi:hypothetical protein
VATFPALSVAEHWTLALPTDPVSTESQLEDATPDSASLAPAEAVAVWPWVTGSGLTVGVSIGLVASYLNGYRCAPLVLPALSVQVPGTLAVALSGPSYVGAVHPAMPEVASCPVKATVTGALYQPAALGARSGVPVVTMGAVASRLIVTACCAVPPALAASQVNVTPAVSVVMVAGPQPLVFETVDPSSVTVQVSETSLVYQPLLPTAPVTVGVITGGVASGAANDTTILPSPELTPPVTVDPVGPVLLPPPPPPWYPPPPPP